MNSPVLFLLTVMSSDFVVVYDVLCPWVLVGWKHGRKGTYSIQRVLAINVRWNVPMFMVCCVRGASYIPSARGAG